MSAIRQHEAAEGGTQDEVPVAITTHLAREGAVREAMRQIESLDVVVAPPVCIRVVAEREEYRE